MKSQPAMSSSRSAAPVRYEMDCGGLERGEHRSARLEGEVFARLLRDERDERETCVNLDPNVWTRGADAGDGRAHVVSRADRRISVGFTAEYDILGPQADEHVRTNL